MASSGSHGEKPWQEEGRVSDPRGYDRARIDRWSCPARVPANEVRHPSPKPPGGAPGGERTGSESVRYTPRKRGVTRLASAIVECAFLGAPPTPSLGRAEGRMRSAAPRKPRKGKVLGVWLFEIVRGKEQRLRRMG